MSVNKMIVSITCLLFLNACVFDNSERFVLNRIPYSQLQGWQDGPHLGALNAFAKSCTKIIRYDDQRMVYPKYAGKAAGWKSVCQQLIDHPIEDNHAAKAFFEKNFVPFSTLYDGVGFGLFTGYYVPELKGSFTKTQRFKYPLYALPHDNTAMDLTRKQITGGTLKNNNLELLYLDDKIEAFFLQIQGSGRISLPDDTVVTVGYAGRNNHEYKSIGEYFVHNNLMQKEDITAQSIKGWLRDNPEKTDDILNYNQSYVFMEVKSQEAHKLPSGGQGVELTPMHSIAIDKNFIPYSAPIWLSLMDKKKETLEYKEHLFLVAQDTGSAIKGPIRGDIFFGIGTQAGEKAGRAKEFGKYFIFLPSAVVKNNRFEIMATYE